MKEINKLLHITSELKTLKSIIEHGFKTSYAIEKFGNRNILVPMISFSNILLRDIGENEVVNYGKYAIGINREFAINIGLNPVCYVFENSIMEKAILNLHDLTIIPQSVHIWKEMADKLNDFTKVSDYVHFKGAFPEVLNLMNEINQNTNIDLVHAIKSYSAKIYENAYFQLLLAKPYKVANKKGEIKVAYNEREWRKSFENLGYIFESDINGNINSNFEKWKVKKKPHFNSPEYTLKVEIENINYIIVDLNDEIEIMEDFLFNLYGKDKIEKLISNDFIKIGTLENLKKTE